MNLLHLEDSVLDAELVFHRLNQEWPDCSVTRVHSAVEFEAELAKGGFDIIISDYSLPGFDGLQALALARARSPDTPFIFLSGTIGEERAIDALRRGASDYVLKDRPARLVQAVRVALDASVRTRRHRVAERRLQQQAALLDKAHDAIMVVDGTGCVTYWNDGATRLYGWTPEEALGRERQSLLGPTNGAGDAVWREGSWKGELHLKTRDGEERLVEASWTLVPDVFGARAAIFCIESDITVQRQLEAQLRHAQRLESIGLLAGGIAHDLNNVLSPILLAVELLRVGPEGERIASLLDTMETSARHGANLVRQVLAFGRGAEGQKTEMSLRPLVHEVAQFLRQTLPAGIGVVTHAERDLPLVLADATQLKQVLLNLAINARDAMPGGGKLTITARSVPAPPALQACAVGDRPVVRAVRVDVEDTGVGIPPEIVARIFDAFFTTKEKGKGTGLGLSLVQRIVMDHCGTVSVASEPGRGATFSIHLPVLEEPPRESFPDIPVDELPEGRGEGIVVIDDTPGVRQLAAAVLEKQGYSVWSVGDGEAALALLRRLEGRVELVLTDLVMPGPSGVSLVAELEKQAPDVRVVAMSGLPEAAEGLPKGMPFLAKPLEASALLTVVRRTIDS